MKQLRKFKTSFSFILVLTLIFTSMSLHTFARGDKSVEFNLNHPDYMEVNNRDYKYNDIVKLVDGVTYVKLRDFFEHFGAEVNWRRDYTAVIFKSKYELRLYPNNTLLDILQDGIHQTGGFVLKHKVKNINGSLYVPIRSLMSCSFGVKVYYNKYTKKVRFDVPSEHF